MKLKANCAMGEVRNHIIIILYEIYSGVSKRLYIFNRNKREWLELIPVCVVGITLFLDQFLTHLPSVTTTIFKSPSLDGQSMLSW